GWSGGGTHHSAHGGGGKEAGGGSVAIGSARRGAERLRYAVVAQKHSCGDGRGVLGGAGQRLESGAVPAQPHAEHARGIETKDFRTDAAGTGDCGGGGGGLCQPGNRRVFQNQRGYGEASPQ